MITVDRPSQLRDTLIKYYNFNYQQYTLEFLKMTTVMNEKSARAYLKSLQDKLLKKVKTITKKITTDDLVEMIIQLLPSRCSNSLESHEAMRVITRHQEIIVDNQCQIQYLKRKATLQDQLTSSFIKSILKDRNKILAHNICKLGTKRENSFLNLPSLSRIDSSITQLKNQQKLDDSFFQKSPIGSISRRQDQESRSSRYERCATSRSKISPCKYQTSEFAQQLEPDEKQKIRALKRLRKLEKYVFEKQNVRKDKSLNKIWNCGVSPTKKRYKQQNDNLKVIQSNLVTHLSLLQKFRQIPSIQGLVAREEAMKKKERNLKELSEALEKKQLELNKKHSDLLKRQKSHKVL